MLSSTEQEALSSLRKKLRNLKRRKFVTDTKFQTQFEIQNTLWEVSSYINRLETALKRLDQLEQRYHKAKRHAHDTTDKTAGRNMLLPRLGR